MTAAATPWLAIVGIGEDGLDGLTPAARTLVDTAEVLVGGTRHLDMVPNGAAERMTWATPLSDTVDAIAAHRGRRVTVLATGDPMSYGIGVTLARRWPAAEMTILPAVGAFSLASARLGWPLAETATITLHGRPLETLNLHLAPGARILALSDSGATPAEVAALLCRQGYGPSRITVLEHIGGPRERLVEGRADAWDEPRGADLNTVAIACVAGQETAILGRVPGLPDDAFVHDGQLTKRETRAATLAALIPLPGQMLWDVGAGAGSVAIEWLRGAPASAAVAIERRPARVDMIARNAANLGTPNLKIVHGEAPAALADLPAPDAVFVGGGVNTPGLVEACWAALAAGGRLVANAVTMEGEAALVRWHGELGGAMTRIAVSRLQPVGPYHGWKPLMTVTQLAVHKARA